MDAPSADPEQLYRYRDGLYAVDLLTAAIVHLDFFTWLAAHPSTVPDILRRFDLQPRPADVMLTLFSANGLIRREGDRLHATELAREFLSAESPRSVGPYYAALKDRPITRDFLTVLRTGRPANWGATDAADWHTSMEDPAFARRFLGAMDARGALLGPEVASRVDFSECSRLLDVGGGSGIYACAIAQRYPGLSATVFDRPPVDRIAAAYVAERGFASRVGVHAGDFLEDELPHGYDAHLFANVLHDWDADVVSRLLALSFRALQAGGLVVIHDAFIDAEKTGPLPVAEYSTFLMHASQGKCYSISEYDAMLAAAGFQDVRFAPTPIYRGVMSARKPRGVSRSSVSP